LRSDEEEDASADLVEAKDEAFEDDDAGLGLRSEQKGYKQLDEDGYGSNENTAPESSGNDDVRSKPEIPDAENDPAESDNEQDDIALPDDPDAPKTKKDGSPADADVASSSIIIGSSQHAEKSIVDESIDDAKAVIAASARTPPSTDDGPQGSIITMPDVADNSEEVEDASSSDSLPSSSFRGLYRQEHTAASQHFLHSSVGREGFGFQAISRALGVPIRETAEEAESDETQDSRHSDSDFGTEVEDLAFHQQGEQEPSQMLRALERNVQANRARHQVTQSSGVFEISSDT
jgi:hypothetical protein